ncbi:hypothetical protein SAMN04488510_1032 [Fervidobacterium changbaicum]|uniref:Uncharacterized protein n=1 Tax=Fervidobacterium changbaicum TaxID=310769 RepID=A0ABX5QRC8_9BACT|nr:hypothetical protein [Fervidobacterium changbaicum]QAV32990.1 hypothetical protein CBS1_04080 [Fervidobacterium changbaicum]SDH00368.1 hypothetical protein SAMN04488510_1032 [Fervidobacterium changbaicum]
MPKLPKLDFSKLAAVLKFGKSKEPKKPESKEQAKTQKGLGVLLEKLKFFLTSLWHRKVLFFSVVGAIVLLGILIALLFRPKLPEAILSEGTQTVENLIISIPTGAFPYEKSFKVRVVSQDSVQGVLSSGNFVSPIYELIPSDGRYDMATLPIKVRYYFPSRLIGSNDSNALAFAGLSSDGKVYNIISGSFIDKDSRGYFVEASFFVVPRWLGVVSVPGKVLKTGIQEVYRVVSAYPPILIIPGSDANFAGYYESAKVTPLSTWQGVFPERSIYVYRYPLNDTKSYNYTRAFKAFRESNPIPSPILFEAERLAQELKRYPDVQFDVLAHEVGGLILYYCLATHPEIKNIRKVAYVSTPFYGTNVVDPRLATTVYASKPSAAALLYNLPESVVATLQGYLKSYIEAVNIYYSDVLPNSEFLKRLQYFPYRTDIPTIAYMGNTPPLSIDVGGSLLEKLYPELTMNLGDGVVTKNSARLPYMTLKIFNGSWNDFYSSEGFIEEIKRFFAFEIPQIPAYKDDTFAERVRSEKEKVFERFITSGSAEQFYVDEWKIGDNPYVKFLRSYNYPGTQVAVYGGIVYTADEKGLYIAGTRVWEEYIMGLKETIDGVSYGTQTKVYYRKLADTVAFEQTPSDDFIATKDYAIFAKPRSNDKVDFVDNTGNVLATLRGVYGKVIYDGNEILFMTNREVYRYLYGVKYTAPLGLRNSYDLTYAIVADDYILATTRAYGLLIFDKLGNYAYTGEGWIGNLGLYRSGNFVVAVGDSFITLIDVSARRIHRIVEDVAGIVYDATVWEDKLYLMTSEGLLIFKIG